MRLRTVLENGKKAKGQKEYKKLVNGEKLTRNEQIKAMCYDCQAGYADFVGDCETTECPLYDSHPYNPNRSKRFVSDKTRKKMAANLSHSLGNKNL